MGGGGRGAMPRHSGKHSSALQLLLLPNSTSDQYDLVFFLLFVPFPLIVPCPERVRIIIRQKIVRPNNYSRSFGTPNSGFGATLVLINGRKSLDHRMPMFYSLVVI